MSASNKPGILFWIIGIIALLWNGMGCFNYIAQAYEMDFYKTGFTEAQIAFMDTLPAWNTALFAIAVFAGLIASIAFLMKKKISVMLFIVSFIPALIGQVYWLFGTEAPEVMKDHSPYVAPIMVVVLGIVFIWYSKKMKAEGVLAKK